MINDLDLLMRLAVTEVFDTMLHSRITPAPVGCPILNGGNHVASAVGFIGSLTGVVYIYSSESLAFRITRNLLGMEEAEELSDEMINDAMGELANMVVGQIKSRFADRGFPCVLTIPSIVRGSNFSIESISSTERQVCCFRCDPGGQLVIETLIKPSTDSENGTEDSNG